VVDSHFTSSFPVDIALLCSSAVGTVKPFPCHFFAFPFLSLFMASRHLIFTFNNVLDEHIYIYICVCVCMSVCAYLCVQFMADRKTPSQKNHSFHFFPFPLHRLPPTTQRKAYNIIFFTPRIYNRWSLFSDLGTEYCVTVPFPALDP
jgi:hypothetical protein